jgi:hypothetical protein
VVRRLKHLLIKLVGDNEPHGECIPRVGAESFDTTIEHVWRRGRSTI